MAEEVKKAPTRSEREAAIKDKVLGAIEAKKVEVAQTMFNQPEVSQEQAVENT